MRYAYTTFRRGETVGVEPQLGQDHILITNGDHSAEIRIDDREQMESVLRLLEDAAEILGWYDMEGAYDRFNKSPLKHPPHG